VHEALVTGAAGARLGPELTGAVQRLLRENATLLAAADTQIVLVHGDYKAQNLLVRQAGASWDVAAVLDWEFAFAGSPLFDVAICLRYGDILPPAFTTAFAAGYRAHGGILPPDWRRIIRLLDLVNLCGFLDAPDARGPMIAEVTALLRATVAGWQSVPRGE
jgi:aminoglycoside phosphotransferase (APT) family kinase protein